MKTLFLRIFIWFWVVMALVVAFLMVSSPYMTRSRARLEQWQHSAERYLQRRAEAAVQELARSGPEGMLETRRRRGGPEGKSDRPLRGGPEGKSDRPLRGGPDRHLRLFLFDSEGNELLEQPVERRMKSLAQRVSASGQQEMERAGSSYMVALPALDQDGGGRVVIASLRLPPRLTDLLEPRVLLPRLVFLVVVVGALSFWLARHFTSPLSALRRAARQITQGDLSARVGKPINRRRDEVGDLARDFDTMAERLQAMISSQQRLLRDVSHELRSPLARQAVALGLVRQQAGESVQPWLDRIEREGERIDVLIGQLLTLTRLEAGTVVEQQVDLASLITDVAAEAELEADARGCSLLLEKPEQLLITACEELLRSALDNVVRNAIHHTADATTVEISLQDQAGLATICVRDHGPGAPESSLPHLLEPFYRVDEARSNQAGGTGLGLTIAARAIHLHNGTIKASNADGGGLMVEITLPTS
jgi:two-component system sensor histidine kinase CpxA